MFLLLLLLSFYLFLIRNSFAEAQDWFHRVLFGEALEFFEVFVLAILLAYVVAKPRRKEVGDDQLRRAIRAENQFFSYLPWLLGFWIFLYLALLADILGLVPVLADTLGLEREQAQSVYEVVLHLLNNLTCIPFVGMFYELAEKTVDRIRPAATRLWWPMLEFIILVAAVEYALGTMSSYTTKLAPWAFLISGLLVGVCTGLFVSKLTSRLFTLQKWMLVVLIVYVVQQPVFAVVTRHEPMGYFLVLMALCGKFALLVVVEWKRYTLRILYFMFRAAQIEEDERTRDAYDEFKEIAHQTFSETAQLSDANSEAGVGISPRAILDPGNAIVARGDEAFVGISPHAIPHPSALMLMRSGVVEGQITIEGNSEKKSP